MAALHPLSISVRTNNPQLVEDICQSSGSCSMTEPVSNLFLIIGTILVLLVFVTAVLHFKKASTAIQEERSRTAEESDALSEFIRRVESVEPSQPQSNPMMIGGATAPQPDSASITEQPHSIEKIQHAYEETMMAVPHYDEEYGETLFVNMAAEFGSDIATAVTEGSEFTSPLKSAIVEKSRESYKQREQLLSGLDTEASELRSAESSAQSINHSLDEFTASDASSLSYDELQGWWHQLNDLERSCTDILKNRQLHIHSRAVTSNAQIENTTFNEYLYGSLGVVYPVLVSFAELNEQIRQAKRSVVDELTRRV